MNWKQLIIRKLKPTQYVKNIHEINFNELKAIGIKGIIFDLDDTLVPRTNKEVSLESADLVSKLKEQGFKLCLTSNSRHPSRVKYFAEALDLPPQFLAGKPLPSAFKKALQILGTSPKETAVIGDQLFMDILGGNIMQMYTILVQYQTPETFFLRQFMRWTEAQVLSLIK